MWLTADGAMMALYGWKCGLRCKWRKGVVAWRLSGVAP
nr:MAG TPA: hypothetical protein [Caudoviricetes sp.]